MSGGRQPLDAPVARKALGVTFVCLLILCGWLTYAVFAKQFVDVVPVTLRTSRIGLQMEPLADVKIRGIIVGEVRDMHADGDGALLDLAMDPAKLDAIPANVTALITPTSVFGQKVVSLRVPDNASADTLAAGDVIEETRVPVEVQQALSDLYPLLTAVRPADLSATLNAAATALDGRGQRVGDNLERLEEYLTKLNPQLPGLVQDLHLLTEVSDDYTHVLPELGRLLRNQATTAGTLLEKEQDLRALFAGVTGLSDTARGFLEVNGDDIIRLGEVSAPTLHVLEHYAPQYPCLMRGIVNWMPQAAESYRGYVFHINMESIPNQPTGYGPRDDPKYGAAEGLRRPDPTCVTLPDPPYSQADPAPMPPWADSRERDDGIAGSHGKYRPSPAYPAATPMTSGWAGTSAEQQVIDALVAPMLDLPARQVPDVATLLFGPIARGAQVSMR